MLKNVIRIKLILLILASVLLGFGANLQAENGDWEYVFAPYLHGASLDGTVAVRGREADIDVSFSEALENLEFGFQGHFEARNEKWIILSDITYMGLGVGISSPPANIDFNQWIVEGGAGYRATENVELLFGGRFNRLDGKINFQGPLGVKVEGNENWFDPYIGARLNLPLGERASVLVRGDIGGFGVGSDFAWTFTPSFVFRATEKISFVAFYRFIDTDYKNEDNGFVFDVQTTGPGAGLAMHF